MLVSVVLWLIAMDAHGLYFRVIIVQQTTDDKRQPIVALFQKGGSNNLNPSVWRKIIITAPKPLINIALNLSYI